MTNENSDAILNNLIIISKILIHFNSIFPNQILALGLVICFAIGLSIGQKVGSRGF